MHDDNLTTQPALAPEPVDSQTPYPSLTLLGHFANLPELEAESDLERARR